LRQIVYARSFDKAVEALGGYRRIDRALEAVIDAISNNPYEFPLIENDFTRARYAVTKQVGDIPPLVVIFEVSMWSVTLAYVEEHEAPY